MTMEYADVVVIGAGVLGCFAARALAAYDLQIIVLEAREDVCTGISRANTGIVYTGSDCKPHTLKSKLCVKANAEFSSLCRELDVPFHRCGSLMVSFGPEAEAVLRRKYAQGRENGVPGLALLKRDDVLAREANLSGNVTAGLFAPGTGTVNPWELGIAAYENARSNGVVFRFLQPLLHMQRTARGFLLETQTARYQTRAVLNCAGLSSDAVRELLQMPLVRIKPTAADYLIFDSTMGDLIRHVIFHEPEHGGKGLTMVPTVDGNLLVGPTERDWSGQPGCPTARSGLDALAVLCRQVVPGLPLNAVIRNFGALRPKPYWVGAEHGVWVPKKRNISDFTLFSEEGLFSLIGIKTPGLTCAERLGAYAAGLICAYLGCDRKNPTFSPVRSGIPRLSCMTQAARGALIRQDPAFGELICRCRDVTRGEVLEAIRRGAVTVDGVKRRTGAGMGRCQGGFCTQRILELLAKAQGLSPAAVTKDGGSSAILSGVHHEVF